MSHSPSRSPWYNQQESLKSGHSSVPINLDRRGSPGFTRAPPQNWYEWNEQRNQEGPSESSGHKQIIPLDERSLGLSANSPRNERPSSPRNAQPAGRRPPSPIRAPSPSPSDQRRDHPYSPRRDRLPSPRANRLRSPPRRPSSPRRERPLSPHRERPLSPRRERPLSPRRERPLSPRRERPLSPRRERPLSSQRERPISPRRERIASPHRERPPSPRRERPPSPRRERPPSPRRERPPSPRRERPPSPRRERPPSPRRERPPSPWRERPRSPRRERPSSPSRMRVWRPRSPPRAYAPPPPPVWARRSRSPPPMWVRRSPPRYGPPRGRSPPRGHWAPPPSDWGRYAPPQPYKRYSPPGRGPPPLEAWNRWSHIPPSSSGLSSQERNQVQTKVLESTSKSSSPVTDSKGDDDVLPPGDDKDEEIESYDLKAYDPEVAIALKYVIPVSGFFCKICHKFYNSEMAAKSLHCKSQNHYDKFAKYLLERKAVVQSRKRAESTEEGGSAKADGAPPEKQIKLEITEEKTKEPEIAAKYDPSQPTSSDHVIKQETDTENEKVAAAENHEVEQGGTAQTECDVIKEIPRLPEEVEKSDVVQSMDVDAAKENPEVIEKSNAEQMDTSAAEENLAVSEEVEKTEAGPAVKMDATQSQIVIKNETLDTSGAENGINQTSDLSDADGLVIDEGKNESADDGVVNASLENVRKLKVTELKANLEKRGLKCTGLKPLLLKRLEKVLLEEAAASAAASDTEENKAEEQKVNDEQKSEGVDDQTESTEGKLVVLKLDESDVEPANRKTQWITEREIKIELLQIEGVKEVVSLRAKRHRLFNGRRTNVEWTINLVYDGKITEDGLSFSIPSHQQLPFTAKLAED